MPNTAALLCVKSKLEANRVPHFCWIEPDYDFGFTAIATAPLSAEQKAVLANYRLLSHHSSGTAKAACGVTADGGANAVRRESVSLR